MRNFLRRWALPASLVVNLLLLGIIVGGMVSSHKGPPDKDGRRIGFSPLEQAVPEAARAKIAPLLKQERPAIREDFRALREARAEVREALQRTPYDAAAAAAALDRLRDRSIDVQSAFHRQMLAIAEALSPEERAAFLEALDRPRGPKPDAPPPR